MRSSRAQRKAYRSSQLHTYREHLPWARPCWFPFAGTWNPPGRPLPFLAPPTSLYCSNSLSFPVLQSSISESPLCTQPLPPFCSVRPWQCDQLAHTVPCLAVCSSGPSSLQEQPGVRQPPAPAWCLSGPGQCLGIGHGRRRNGHGSRTAGFHTPSC